MKNKLVSVIIPTLNKNENELRAILKNQTLSAYNLKIVKNIKPCAKARNLGAKDIQEDIIIFLDDDVSLGSKDVLEKIVKFIQKNKNTGTCGVGLIVPKEASFFQKRIAKEIPRMELPIPPKDQEADGNITGACFGIKRDVFKKIEGFNESLVSGEDLELFYRLEKNGYKNYLLSNVFFFHYPPKNFLTFFKKFFWYGVGQYQLVHLHPEWDISFKVSNLFIAVLYLFLRTIFLIPHIFLSEISFKNRKNFKLSFKPLRALSSYFSALGFFRGFLKYRGQKP